MGLLLSGFAQEIYPAAARFLHYQQSLANGVGTVTFVLGRRRGTGLIIRQVPTEWAFSRRGTPF